MLQRVDVGTAIVVAAVIVGAAALVIWGPGDSRGEAAALLLAVLGTGAAALRGRLVKRDPATFTEDDAPAVVAERHTADGGKTWKEGGPQ
jgi:hypothetical protein